jgi:hypothetical protein
MTTAEQLFTILANARTKAGNVLTKEQWLGAAQPFLDSLSKKPVKKKNVYGAGLTDDQWFAELAKDPDYSGINLPDEARKCRLYFKGSTVPTRARLLRWFAKATPSGWKPPAAGSPSDALSPDKLNIAPAGWKAAARRAFGDCNLVDSILSGETAWADLSTEKRSKIVCCIS